MKKITKTLLIFLASILMISEFLLFTSINIFEISRSNPQSRVYKFELSPNSSENEIAQILINRMMNKHVIGTLGWWKWVWAYRVEEIKVPSDFNGFIETEIHLKPVFPDSYLDIWTMNINPLGNGWQRVNYLLSIEDRGRFYELEGPYTGG